MNNGQLINLADNLGLDTDSIVRLMIVRAIVRLCRSVVRVSDKTPIDLLSYLVIESLTYILGLKLFI